MQTNKEEYESRLTRWDKEPPTEEQKKKLFEMAKEGVATDPNSPFYKLGIMVKVKALYNNYKI